MGGGISEDAEVVAGMKGQGEGLDDRGKIIERDRNLEVVGGQWRPRV